jgi:histidinol phosphatase-like PHP family hydrolase
MDSLVAHIIDILDREPMDIWASPTYLPPSLVKDYDTLWTEPRRKKVIDAAARNQVAIEISNRYRIPSATFLREAKAAGCKFCFGSNNGGASDLGRCEYGIQMLNECKLDWRDFFVPGAWTARVIERRGSLLPG